MAAGVTFGSHMDAALGEPFLDHGRDIHEGLHHYAGDAFGEKPAQLLLLSRQLAGRKGGQRSDAEIALRADVPPEVRGPRMGQ